MKNKIKSQSFMYDIRKLAEKYDLPVFAVTDGASITKNNGCDAVRNARDCHKEWEIKNGYDPNHDWSKK